MAGGQVPQPTYEVNEPWQRVFNVCVDPICEVRTDQWAAAKIFCFVHKVTAIGHADGMDLLQAAERAAIAFVAEHE